jgi:hypothetical protein
VWAPERAVEFRAARCQALGKGVKIAGFIGGCDEERDEDDNCRGSNYRPYKCAFFDLDYFSITCVPFIPKYYLSTCHLSTSATCFAAFH